MENTVNWILSERQAYKNVHCPQESSQRFIMGWVRCYTHSSPFRSLSPSHTVILHSNPTKLLVYDCSNLLTADKFHFARANPIAYYPVHCIRPLISPFSSLAPYPMEEKKQLLINPLTAVNKWRARLYVPDLIIRKEMKIHTITTNLTIMVCLWNLFGYIKNDPQIWMNDQKTDSERNKMLHDKKRKSKCNNTVL